jgi:hypothetical protein
VQSSTRCNEIKVHGKPWCQGSYLGEHTPTPNKPALKTCTLVHTHRTAAALTQTGTTFRHSRQSFQACLMVNVAAQPVLCRAAQHCWQGL